jgi:U32 family peptidase
MAQIEIALECGVETIYVDFEDIRRGRDAVELVRGHDALPGKAHRVLLATPRIQKAGEEGFFKVIERAEPDGILVRNLGAIRYFSDRPHFTRIGDFSLNVANPLTAEFLLIHGLERLTISYDLNIGQVLDLLRAAPPAAFEVTLHQHMPMFHMEHCVFAAFMSTGTDSTNCGRPCEKHTVELRDRIGQLHPLLADVGCRNTLFRGQAQTGARFFRELRATGLGHFRVELLREDPAATRRILAAYNRLLAGDEEGDALWQEFRASNQLGVTEGTLAGG